MAYFPDPYGGTVRGLENIQQTIRGLSQQYTTRKREERVAELDMKEVELVRARTETEQQQAVYDAEARKRRDDLDYLDRMGEIEARKATATYRADMLELEERRVTVTEGKAITEDGTLDLRELLDGLDPSRSFDDAQFARIINVPISMGQPIADKKMLKALTDTVWENPKFKEDYLTTMREKIERDIQGVAPYDPRIANFVKMNMSEEMPVKLQAYGATDKQLSEARLTQREEDEIDISISDTSERMAAIIQKIEEKKLNIIMKHPISPESYEMLEIWDKEGRYEFRWDIIPKTETQDRTLREPFKPADREVFTEY